MLSSVIIYGYIANIVLYISAILCIASFFAAFILIMDQCYNLEDFISLIKSSRRERIVCAVFCISLLILVITPDKGDIMKFMLAKQIDSVMQQSGVDASDIADMIGQKVDEALGK